MGAGLEIKFMPDVFSLAEKKYRFFASVGKTS